MAGNILNIGKSGLFAAQAGLSTAGHNIANAGVAGFSRQGIVQSSATAQNLGIGFVGSGTQVTDIQRFSDPFLNGQVRTATTSKSAFDAYAAQIGQVDNLLADTTSGLSPALQDFFKSVQDVASNPQSVASRQVLMSGAEQLSSRFQGLNGRLQEIRDGVNDRITASVTVVNSYADRIATLNDRIGALSSSGGGMPNDLMDARDQLVVKLAEQVKVTVVNGDNNSLTVSIGNGQPLVVGTKSFDLATTVSPTDPLRVQVGFVSGTKVVPLGENALSGGELGGLFEFRANTLDRAQNSLGRIATVVATTFNDQNRLGLDANGAPGGDFFKIAPVQVGASRDNASTSTAVVGVTISDASQLTASDYKVSYDGSNYVVTRLADSAKTTINPYPQAAAQTIDGIDFAINGSSTAGDSFIVRPTVNGAASLSVALTDRSRIAAAAPITTNTLLTNSGSGKIGEGSVDKNYLTPGNALTAPLTLTFNGGNLSGFPAGQAVTRTLNGVTTTYPAGTAAIPYESGASYAFGGVNVGFTGAPNNNDRFTVGPNLSGIGDNRNMRLLGALQTANTMDGGRATFQSAYAEMVGFIGSKAREVQVNGEVGTMLLKQAVNAQQSVSGVNLDEEAANLLKYQQAYQAAGKVMQIASTLFDTLLSLGR